MYFNEDSADQMRFSSSCSSLDSNCHSQKDVRKVHRVRRTSLRQLALVSLLLVVTSSLLASTLASPVSSRSFSKKFCTASSSEKMSSSESNYSPLFSSIIKQCETTVDKAKTMAKKWFEAELGQDTYENYIRKLKGQLIGTLPKTINQPTDAQHLEKLDEKATLDKLYKDLALVRNAVAERELVASKREGIDNEIFTNLHTEIIQVIEELRNVFDGFQMHPPSEADKEPNSVRHEYSEEETDRKHRNWLIFHDYIVLVEYTHDVMKHLDEKYCSSTA